MTDYKLQYTPEDLRRQELELRDQLYIWATMKPIATDSVPAKLTNAMGQEVTYLEMGDEIQARLNGVLYLLEHHQRDIYKAENDRQHLSEHQETKKPLEQWELELMGLRKVGEIRYELICYTCADKNAQGPDYFGKKLTWQDTSGNEVIALTVEWAMLARDAHLDAHPDHNTDLELI